MHTQEEKGQRTLRREKGGDQGIHHHHHDRPWRLKWGTTIGDYKEERERTIKEEEVGVEAAAGGEP